MNTGVLGQSSTHIDAHVTEQDGYGVVTTFSSVMEEYEALRETVGLLDFSTHGKFKVSGPDYINWLSALVSRDLDYFSLEETLFSLCLNEQGEVLDIVTLYKYEDAILIEAETASRNRLAAWFNQHSNDTVVIEDVSDELALIAFEGPQAFKIAQTLIDSEISSIQFQSFVEVEKYGKTMTLARVGYTGEYGYKIFAPANIALSLWDELYAKVKAHKGRLCGNNALEIAMLEVRQPVSHIETKNLNVRNAGLEWLIDIRKAVYIGKEVVDTLVQEKVEQRLVGFVVSQNVPLTPGDRILIEDREIGKVVVTYYSPTLKSMLGLALNREPFTVPGLSWIVQNSQGMSLLAHSVSSPYIIPKSWTIKML